jgi:FLVCR family MFS transporter 7
MLAALCLLNISNGMMWLSFAPIPNYTARYYDVSVSDVDWFSIVYFIVSLLVGFVSIGILDTFGLKVSLYLGAGLNLSGSILRYVSTVHPIVCSSVFSKSGFMVAMIGQILTACAQPFMLYAPTKLASFWFGPKERAVCTNFASIANPIGLAVAQLASPYIVTSTEHLPRMLWIYTVPAGVATVVVAVAFWWSKPPLPPTATSDDNPSPPFFRGLWMTITNGSFWILMLVWGGGAGLFNALLTLLPQFVCPFGYSDTNAGLWGALMIFCGLVGATLAGLLIDYTKLFKEIATVSLCLAILSLVWFTEVFTMHDQPVLIGFSLCVFGFFALPLIPACMELGVEITYPVAEATSTGLLWSIA